MRDLGRGEPKGHGTNANAIQMANGPKPEKSERTKAREAFFLEFAKIIRTKFPKLPLMVTGGFRTRQGMEAALEADDCDMIGIGRPAIINPSLPANLILNPEVPDADARLFDKKRAEPHWIVEKLGMKSIVGAGAEVVRHVPTPFASLCFRVCYADLVLF